MTMFADARTDDAYNEDFLNRIDSAYLAGFDYALEIIKNLMEGNLEVYEDELTDTGEGRVPDEDEVFATREDLYQIIRDNSELISIIISHWHESERDMLVSSMIDGMDENEYKAIRNKVLRENEKKKEPKEYFDSRKYALTGEKVFRRE